jgi:hypothetical protein
MRRAVHASSRKLKHKVWMGVVDTAKKLQLLGSNRVVFRFARQKNACFCAEKPGVRAANLPAAPPKKLSGKRKNNTQFTPSERLQSPSARGPQPTPEGPERQGRTSGRQVLAGQSWY